MANNTTTKSKGVYEFNNVAEAQTFFRKQKQATLRCIGGRCIVFVPSWAAAGHPTTIVEEPSKTRNIEREMKAFEQSKAYLVKKHAQKDTGKPQ